MAIQDIIADLEPKLIALRQEGFDEGKASVVIPVPVPVEGGEQPTVDMYTKEQVDQMIAQAIAALPKAPEVGELEAKIADLETQVGDLKAQLVTAKDDARVELKAELKAKFAESQAQENSAESAFAELLG